MKPPYLLLIFHISFGKANKAPSFVNLILALVPVQNSWKMVPATKMARLTARRRLRSMPSEHWAATIGARELVRP